MQAAQHNQHSSNTVPGSPVCHVRQTALHRFERARISKLLLPAAESMCRCCWAAIAGLVCAFTQQQRVDDNLCGHMFDAHLMNWPFSFQICRINGRRLRRHLCIAACRHSQHPTECTQVKTTSHRSAHFHGTCVCETCREQHGF